MWQCSVRDCEAEIKESSIGLRSRDGLWKIATCSQFYLTVPSWTGSTAVRVHSQYCTSVKIIKNEVGCRDDTVPKTVDTRRHCEEE